MKVPFEESVLVCGEAHLTIDNITDALNDELADAIETEASDVPTERTKQFIVTRFVRDALGCIASATDAMIQRVPVSNRRLIATELRKQAARWDKDTGN